MISHLVQLEAGFDTERGLCTSYKSYHQAFARPKVEIKMISKLTLA